MLSQNMKNCSTYFQTLRMGLKENQQIMLSPVALDQFITIFDQAERDARAMEANPVPLSAQIPEQGYENVVVFIPKNKRGDHDLAS